MQLEHVTEERSRVEHGAVTVLSSDGTTLAHSDDFQHNRQYHARFEMADQLVEQIHEKMIKFQAPVEAVTAAAAAIAATAPAEGAAAA